MVMGFVGVEEGMGLGLERGVGVVMVAFQQVKVSPLVF